MKHKNLLKAALVLVMALAYLPWGSPARAATWVVDTTSDVSDGGCMVTPQCSLREAINAANGNSSLDIIQFNIPPKTDPGCSGGGVCTIQPTSPLPALTDDGTTIDGYSQPGASPAEGSTPAALKIEIDGTYAGLSTSGLTINSANNVIRGLAINRFAKHGVDIYGSGATGNVIVGNYIGTNANGTAALGNDWRGVYIHDGAQNNTIGGDTAGERNVISNNDSGVYIYGSDGNTVSGNYIGTDASGTGTLGNGVGVYIGNAAQNNSIEQNIISNGYYGVRIRDSNTMNNTVSGNYIGTDESGTLDLGNTEWGVQIDDGAQNNTIGPNNIIAHSGYDGVEVKDDNTSGNTITQNSIFSNTVMGIDLRSGANGNIAAPVIQAIISGSVEIVGTACAGCIVEVFGNGDTDGEGETYIDDTTATPSGVFTLTVSSLTYPFLTATATDAISGTSEFSTASPGGPVYLPIIMRNY